MRPPTILILGGARPHATTEAVNLGDQAQLLEGIARLRTLMPDARFMCVANSVRERAEDDAHPLSHTVIAYVAGRGNGLLRHIPRPVVRIVRSALLLLNATRVAAGRRAILLSGLGNSALRELEAADALFLCGAGALNDRYATGVGGLWCLLIRIMSALGKPVVASGQQVGPLTHLVPRLIVRWGLGTIDALGVREPRSFECAVRLGVPEERIILTGDDAWDLRPVPADVARSILARHGVDGPFIAAQVRFGASTGWRSEDAPRVGAALSRLAEDFGAPVVFVFLSHSRFGNEELETVDRVCRYVGGHPVILDERLDASTTKAILGEALLGVGISYHFCIFAASMKTPVVAIHSSPYMRHKMQGLAELERQHLVALSREQAVRSDLLVRVAHGLIDRHARHNAGEDASSSPARNEAMYRLRDILEAR